ncbi:MAG: glycoside hydrolase family 43 protein [Treponema sp.]|nr:glycoside hydrolase family 43 protein [Treponema sp.]
MTIKYKNPILSGFYPDPSICRAGNDFYLTTSTFAYFPGLPIFHSNDLVHWKQIGSAIDRPGQLNYDGHRISQGLFAPTIRENNGTFYILCTLIDTGGNFIITAKDPAGPWSDPVWLEGANGIDPSIFFDTDGKVWYCGTRPAPEGEAYPGNYEIYIYEMDLSLLEKGKNPLTGESKGIWRGALRDVIWPEGPHIYKINRTYFLLHAEGGTSIDHAVCIAKADDIHGPWVGKKSNPVITHRHLGRRAKIVNVGHADLVDDAHGNWWMVMLASRPFHGVCPLGRETFMLPVIWEDGWPCIATSSGMIEDQIKEKINVEEVLGSGLNENHIKKNSVIKSRWIYENACDHFNGKLPVHWLVLRMPVSEKDAAFSFKEREGALRLFTRDATMRSLKHPAFAGRRIKDKEWVFSALIEFEPKESGESAGLILLQSEDYQYRLEIFADNGSSSLRLVKASGKEKEDEIIAEKKETFAYNTDKKIKTILACQCFDMKISFFFGKDQYSLSCIADNVDARILSTDYAGGFVGSLAGVFASGNGKNIDNYADVFWAEYRGL